MPSQESLTPKNDWAERVPRGTLGAGELGTKEDEKKRQHEGAFDGIKFESETPDEGERRPREQTKEQQMIEFLNTMTVERLGFEQDRLQAFIDDFEENMSDLSDLSPESAALTQELIRDEIRLLEMVKTQRVLRRDVLGKIPKQRVPDEAKRFVTPDSDLPFLPTEYPPGQEPTVKASIPARPRAMKRAAQDIGTQRTELPKSDLPN